MHARGRGRRAPSQPGRRTGRGSEHCAAVPRNGLPSQAGVEACCDRTFQGAEQLSDCLLQTHRLFYHDMFRAHYCSSGRQTVPPILTLPCGHSRTETAPTASERPCKCDVLSTQQWHTVEFTRMMLPTSYDVSEAQTPLGCNV